MHYNPDIRYSYGNFTFLTINPKDDYAPKPMFEQQKNSQYTTIYHSTSNYPTDTQIDFQIEADLYHEGQIRVYDHQLGVLDFTGFMIDGYISDQTSGWSNTETINLANGRSVSTSSNPTQSPTITPTVPELSWLVILPLLLSVFTVAMVDRYRKTSNYFEKS